jgi:hypothetical protein
MKLKDEDYAVSGDHTVVDFQLPDTPFIGEDELKEISNFECEDLGNGIMVFRNAFNVERFVLSHIDEVATEAHKNRWNYITGEDGVEYGINEDGFRYRMENIPEAPVRLLAPVNANTPEKEREYFFYLEDVIYKCLIKYVDHFPLVVGSLWWKTRGHILRYDDRGRLGCHQDNDTNYKVTNGVRYMPRGQVALRQTAGALCYFNDCVEKEEEYDGTNFVGGQLRFAHLGITYKPRKGDIIFFPTNYICAHEVQLMTKGTRYAYLTFFGQGGTDMEANIQIREPWESKQWCPPVWFNSIYDDYEKYCKSEYSIWSSGKTTLEPGVNPVFQNRCVAQYGNTHTAQEIEKPNAE